jgi:cell division protein ZapA
MTATKSATIKLLNHTYQVKCPEGEEEHLLLAADKLHTHMLANKKKHKKLDDFQALLLASLEVCHELILYKSKQEQQRVQVSEFMTSLENKINEVVKGSLQEVES